MNVINHPIMEAYMHVIYLDWLGKLNSRNCASKCMYINTYGMVVGII